MGVRSTYPLPKDEERALAANMAASQALLLLGGIAGAAVLAGLATGNWAQAVLGFGWAAGIGRSLAAGLPQSVLVGAGTGALLLALAWAAERLAQRSESGRAAVLDARQGVNGEMPRLRVPVILALSALVGIAEELLFRYVLIGLVLLALGGTVLAVLAAPIAVFASSFAFWIVHVRYRDFWSAAVVLVLALALGSVFVATGSLLAVALAHGIYDGTTLLSERRKMRTEPDYFGGKVPTRIVLDQLGQARTQPRDGSGR